LCFWAFLSKGSSKTPQTTLQKIHVEGLWQQKSREKLFTKKRVCLFLAFVGRIFGCFLAWDFLKNKKMPHH
jgi:hypothetical protein